jgi:hypothetical protein
MNIREYHLIDKREVDEIYNEFYHNNEYPDFGSNTFHRSFVVTDDDDKIVLAAGVKTIAEAIALTDRNRSVRVRQEALLQALGSTIFIASAAKFGQVHAFVRNEDEGYIKHLQKYGFRLLDAKVLVLDIGMMSVLQRRTQ